MPEPIKCPDCDDSGIRQVGQGQGIGIGLGIEIAQCEFCYTEPNSLFNRKRECKYCGYPVLTKSEIDRGHEMCGHCTDEATIYAESRDDGNH